MKRFVLLFTLISSIGYTSNCHAQNILKEGFEGSTYPPAGWLDSITIDDGCCTSSGVEDWEQVSSYTGYGPYAPAHTGSQMLYYDSYNSDYGNQAELSTPALDFSPYTGTGSIQVSFWMYRDAEFYYYEDNVSVYVNTTTGSYGGTLLGTIYRDASASPSVSSNGWYQYTFTIPSSYSGTTNYIVFQANSAYGYDMFLDDISVDHTIPSPIVTANYTYCQYAPTSPLSATGVKLKWYTTLGGTPSAITPTPNDSFPGTTYYYVTQTIGGMESQPAKITVTVYAKPSPPYAADTAFEYCQFDNATIPSVIGQNLLWYTSASGGTGSVTPPVPSTSTAGITYYYVSQTVNGCESDRLKLTINIKSKPSPPGVTSPVVYCQNDTAAPLTASGLNLLWYLSPSGGVASSISPVPTTLTPRDTTIYYVSQTVNGCESDRSQVMVIIKFRPNALIVASSPFVCQYDTMSFSYYGSATATASYLWTVPEGANIISGNGEGPLVVRFDSFGHLPVHLLVSDGGCSAALTTYYVDVRQAPFLPFSVPKDACVGQVVEVRSANSNEDITNYNWDFGGGTVVYSNTGPGPYGISYNIPGTKYVSLTVTTNQCPSGHITDTITVHPLGDAVIAKVSNSSPCQGDSVTFVPEQYDPGNMYAWTPGQFYSTERGDGSVFSVVQSNVIRLTVTTAFGCVSTDSANVNLTACCSVIFPNAFSPNGDGKNDIFRPIQGEGLHQIKRFSVVDRWGQTMFETTDQNQGWDGKHNGVPQDIGTYYWYINYVCGDNKTYKEEGEVILVR